MAQIISTNMPPVSHQEFIADASKPFDTVVMIGNKHHSDNMSFLQEATEKAYNTGKNTLIIGDGKNEIPASYTTLLEGKVNDNTQIILWGHGHKRNDRHVINLVAQQKDIAQIVQDIVTTSQVSSPKRFFVYSCHAAAAQKNFRKIPSPAEVILDGSHNRTLQELNLEAISYMICEGSLPCFSSDGSIDQRFLYDHITVIKGNHARTYTPLSLPYPTNDATTRTAIVSTGLITGGTPQIPTIEILQKSLLLSASRKETEKIWQLLRLGIDPNAAKTPLLKKTPLHFAARHEDPAAIELLLTHHADPYLLNEEGASPFHIAVQTGNKKTVGIFLTYGTNSSFQNEEGFAPLHIAAQEGHTAVAEVLLAHGTDPNLPNKEKVTPLHLAAQEGHAAAVEVLLTHGAAPNSSNKKKVVPLHLAALEGHTAVVEVLLTHGADPNLPDEEGFTPLHIAVLEGHTAVVKTLLTHGADPNLLNEEGFSPLHLAAQEGHTAAVEVLLAHGANPNFPSSEGVTSLHLAARQGYTAVVEVLLAHGADPNFPNKEGLSPLHLAANKGQTATVKTLLKHPKINPNAFSSHTTTPLYLATQKMHLTTVLALLKHPRTAPNALNHEKNTALHIAIDLGNKEIAGILLTYGANWTLKNSHGATPEDYLHQVKNPETKAAIEKMLEQAESTWQKERSASTTLENTDLKHATDKNDRKQRDEKRPLKTFTLV